jgi:hypothetical protein
VSKKSRGRSAPNPGWFPKGRSGNLKGRPRGSRVATGSAFEVLLDRTLTVPDRGGGTREITVEEALQLRTYQDALAGKRMAMREVMKWIIKREAWLEKHEPEVAESGSVLLSDDPRQCGCRTCASGYRGTKPRPCGFSRKTGAASPGTLGGSGCAPPEARWPTSDRARAQYGETLYTRFRYCALATRDWKMTSQEDDAEDTDVGYRRPPTTRRFKKGRSGNPAGRPRGHHRQAPYEAVLVRC